MNIKKKNNKKLCCFENVYWICYSRHAKGRFSESLDRSFQGRSKNGLYPKRWYPHVILHFSSTGEHKLKFLLFAECY
jgi:hypothetical protein